MIENGTDVQKRPCGPGQLASEFGINFGKNRYDFCIRTRITAIIRPIPIVLLFSLLCEKERNLFKSKEKERPPMLWEVS